MTRQAAICKKKMDAAVTLINGLGGERIRWTQESKDLKQQHIKLVGDTLIACSFLSYSGPFNQVFRELLMEKWNLMVEEKGIPFTTKLQIMQMLKLDDETSEWSLQGLPSDFLSLQNQTLH